MELTLEALRANLFQMKAEFYIRTYGLHEVGL